MNHKLTEVVPAKPIAWGPRIKNHCPKCNGVLREFGPQACEVSTIKGAVITVSSANLMTFQCDKCRKFFAFLPKSIKGTAQSD